MLKIILVIVCIFAVLAIIKFITKTFLKIILTIGLIFLVIAFIGANKDNTDGTIHKPDIKFNIERVGD